MIAAASICGRIGPGLVGSQRDRKLLEKMRAETDASLLGAGTLRAGDPEMRGPNGVLPEGRIRAVISNSGNIPYKNRKLFSQGPRPLIFTSAAESSRLVKKIGQLAEIITIPRGPAGLSVRAAIDELGRRGAASVLVEGGGKLNYACLAEGVIDEILLTITPKISGDRSAATFADGPVPLCGPFCDLELVTCEAADTSEIFCRYRVKK